MAAKKKRDTSNVTVKRTSTWEWAYGPWTVTHDSDGNGEFELRLDDEPAMSVAREDLESLPTIIARALADAQEQGDRG